jgi:HK97 family phage prohead protease
MSELLIRTFPVELALGDGRTLEGRCVPYGVEAPVADPGQTYQREMFVRGAFTRALRTPKRVLINFEHNIATPGGHAQALEEREDGLWGSFEIHDGPAGDELLTMHRAGVAEFFSIGFMPIGRGRRKGDLVVRTHGHLDHVALVREAAYTGTEALARDRDEITFERPERDQRLDERLAALRGES